MNDRANQELSRRKVRDRSIALVLAGAVLVTPPVAAVSLIDLDIAGLPFPVVYVFVVWFLLIAGAALLSRPLREEDEALGSSQTGDPEV